MATKQRKAPVLEDSAPQADDKEPAELSAADLADVEGGYENDEDSTDVDLNDIEEGDVEAGDDDEVAADLDELGAEELAMLTPDEAAEVIAIDEAAELRALRLEELAMDVDPEGAKTDEFVCQSCFLVKRTSQLADRRKRICRDCAG